MPQQESNKITVLGVMSGTSLDGLDLALCQFFMSADTYRFRILKTLTIPYTAERRQKLSKAMHSNALQYLHLSHLYGKYIAAEINEFLKTCEEKPQLIASHGHTVFHQPASGFSAQIGCGATIAAHTGIHTACDFRTLDTALGGQGAPLVPIGDRLLFPQQDACLNLGGIANISFEKDAKRRAFDICFVNMALNELAMKAGHAYDAGGAMAAGGDINPEYLSQLKNALRLENRISLSREIFDKTLLPLLDKKQLTVETRLATYCSYAAQTIAGVLNEMELKSVLVTGGGAYNNFLIEKIREQFKGELIIPDDEIIQFKEALIFAFLGYLRVHEKINTLNSVTGASCDSIGGALYLAPPEQSRSH